MPLLLHGDGQHTRRFLYAGDAADAFDTILHKGEIGEIYNVDSRHEISNLDLAKKLLDIFGFADTDRWIQHTKDRLFNDRRYAVDGTKLRKLGWDQKTSLEDALAATVEWYSNFAGWFGDIERVLTAHPVVQGDHLLPREASRKIEHEASAGAKAPQNERLSNGANGYSHPEKKRKADRIT